VGAFSLDDLRQIPFGNYRVVCQSLSDSFVVVAEAEGHRLLQRIDRLP
jgi:hypothetical protein